RACEHEYFRLFASNAEVMERRLIGRLHAFAGHGDLGPADGEQRHRAEVDVAPTGDRAGGAELAVGEPRHAESAVERLDALRPRAAAERNCYLLPDAGCMRGRGRRVI